MRLDQLHYLLVTAECHSMQKASHILHVSQQNISKSIKNLEVELNTLLLERTSAGLFLTPDGEKVYLLASEIIEKTKSIEHFCQATQTLLPFKNLKGTFTAITLPGNSKFIYNTIQHFKNSCPFCTLYLEEHEALDAISCLLEKNYEWCLTTLDEHLSLIYTPTFWANYQVYVLKDDVLKVLTSTASQLIQYHSISNKVLAEHPIIFYSTSLDKQNFIEKTLKQHKINHKAFLHTNSQAVFNEALIKNHAIAISSDFIFRTALRINLDQLTLLPLLTRIPVRHVLILKKKLSPVGQVYHQFFLQALEQYNVYPKLYDHS